MDLDQAYNNVAAVGNFAQIMQGFRQRSAETYARHAWQRDIAYGNAVRERFDWFAQANAGAPTLLFIHGGYWQASDKDDYAFIAEGLIEAGFNVGLLEYTLAPEANMSTIVSQIGKALDHLMVHRDALNIGQQVVLCGHSAGGHLTALYRRHPLVTLALPISGLMELEPISRCWLNDKLQLSDEDIRRYSPQRQIDDGAALLVTVGTDELPELIRHSREYANACRAAGQSVSLIELADCHHFAVLDDLAKSDGEHLRALLKHLSL
ncbi:alpha/beta hydrolase [Pseudomonas vancouverensis]|uniref:Alpha/beta hydrolase n=1 Tax=Pseudomonas vancouverensis TaxID=95300 RepID=A0A1H2MS78_PSEVA|nr:alpha/beta hydrolase [Pseudomonas vancouverensis]KAB0494511.1 alpha/beta hydrolase [Pseudomonas vancouverensis]TDB59177.1 alpha/beta hydrolase [Pseudomonas vancouverensis]SDU95815.1 Acetyl esterase/lipase [Pseudomonas vancouverensis]